MKLIPFLSKMNANPPPSSSPPWQWPSCGNIKTLSFRASNDIFTAFEAPEEEELPLLDPVEMVIKGLSSERLLFYEPGETSSILEEAHHSKSATNSVPYKESVAMSMDSKDPCGDFRRSMEEMVEAHGLKDWEALEELLCCYLRVNGKSNHGYIVGAFVDLLVGLSFAGGAGGGEEESSSSLSSSSFTIISARSSDLPSSPISLPSSSLSTSTPPCLSQLLDQENDEQHQEDSSVLS